MTYLSNKILFATLATGTAFLMQMPQAFAEEKTAEKANLYTEQQSLTDLDIDTQFEDVHAEQLRFQKRTLKADEKRLAKESHRIETKLKTVQKRNQELEHEIKILSDKVQKLQAHLDSKTTTLLVARDRHEFLSSKKASLLNKLQPKAKKSIAHKVAKKSSGLKPTHAASETAGRLRL